ncbi:DUF2303 family protein [Reyranella sp.]|uniref:DUF2303 family protein n=1 Tax=Reyranella sp. TaxID=1929291 RepID=UPI003D14E51A
MDFSITDAIDKLKGLGDAVVLPALSQPVVALPAGTSLKSVKALLDEYNARPDRRSGTDTVTDIATLVEWINRHKDGGSVVFCDASRTAPKMLAVIDYHEAGEGDGKARFRTFRAKYDFPLDPRWVAWKGIDGMALDQAAFAAFIEDHVLDLIGPEVSLSGDGETTTVKLPQQVQQLLDLAGGRCAFPNEVMALSRGLDLTANDKVVNRVDLQSGEGSLVFESTHIDKNGVKIDVPRLFMIAVPLFERSPDHYRIPVRLRYRLVSGKVIWVPTLFGADEIMDSAIRDAARTVREQTDRPLFFGWPA